MEFRMQLNPHLTNNDFTKFSVQRIISFSTRLSDGKQHVFGLSITNWFEQPLQFRHRVMAHHQNQWLPPQRLPIKNETLRPSKKFNRVQLFCHCGHHCLTSSRLFLLIVQSYREKTISSEGISGSPAGHDVFNPDMKSNLIQKTNMVHSYETWS